MHPLADAILDARKTVRQKIKSNPAELKRRMARRRMKICTRPPRA